MSIAVKICGLTRAEDVKAAIDAGADALGFVLDTGKVQLDVEAAQALVAVARAYRPTDRRVDAIAVVGRAGQCEIDQLARLGFDGVQVVVDDTGQVPDAEPAFVVPVFFDGTDLLARVDRFASLAGERSTHRGHHAAPSPILPEPPVARGVGTRWAVDGIRGLINVDSAKGGGTGTRADWERAAQVASRVPIMLAGGLTPDNVAEAIARVCPCAVDVSSGVERSAREKDRTKMHAFVRAAKAVDPGRA